MMPSPLNPPRGPLGDRPQKCPNLRLQSATMKLAITLTAWLRIASEEYRRVDDPAGDLRRARAAGFGNRL